MLIEDSEGNLLAMLAEVGVTPGRLDTDQLRAVVDVFRRFVLIPVEDAAPVDDDGDGALAQSGTFKFRGSREFEADLTRQFVEVAEQDPEMWQLSCTLRWHPTEETDALLSGNVWSFDKSWDQFFAEAMELPGWDWALKTWRPATLDVVFGMV